MENNKYILDVGGPLLLLIVFWGGALMNIINWTTAKAYVESERVTFYPGFVLASGILWQIIAGLFLFNPYTFQLGCILLILFTFISSLQFHQFWRKEGIERHKSLISFLSNLGVIGGLLLLMSRGEDLRLSLNFVLL